MARSPRINDTARILSNELAPDDFYEEGHAGKGDRPILFKTLAQRVLDRPTSYRRRVKVVLREIGLIERVIHAHDIDILCIHTWIELQYNMDRSEYVILGMLETLSCITWYSFIKGHTKIDPFSTYKKPHRWFGNGTFGPRYLERWWDHPKTPAPAIVTFEENGEVFVMGRGPKKRLSKSAVLIIKALLEAGTDGLTKNQIEHICGDARGILRRLANSDEDWRKVIDRPRRPGHPYRLAIPPNA